MAHRHKAQAKHKNVGGAATSYGNPNVIAEAKKTKRGGKVHGAAAKHRVEKRARGGKVGSDKAPFSSAHIKGSHSDAHNPHPHTASHDHSHHGTKLATGGVAGK